MNFPGLKNLLFITFIFVFVWTVQSLAVPGHGGGVSAPLGGNGRAPDGYKHIPDGVSMTKIVPEDWVHASKEGPDHTRYVGPDWVHSNAEGEGQTYYYDPKLWKHVRMENSPQQSTIILKTDKHISESNSPVKSHFVGKDWVHINGGDPGSITYYWPVPLTHITEVEEQQTLYKPQGHTHVADSSSSQYSLYKPDNYKHVNESNSGMLSQFVPPSYTHDHTMTATKTNYKPPGTYHVSQQGHQWFTLYKPPFEGAPVKPPLGPKPPVNPGGPPQPLTADPDGDQARTKISDNGNYFMSNEQYLKNFSSAFDLKDARSVFDYIISRLPSDVNVNPTELYYYFRFRHEGNHVCGCLSLSAKDVDVKREIGLGYHPCPDEGRENYSGMAFGGGGNFGFENGIIIEKVDDFTYRLTSNTTNNTVTFHINRKGIGIEPYVTLSRTKKYAGYIFDEAGIELDMVFDSATRSLAMYLRGDGAIPTTFTEVAENVLREDRTGFYFYNHPRREAKILIGVNGWDTLNNTENDGPHDQMPDMAIKLGFIPNYADYLRAAYPGVDIDVYGNYNGQQGTRIAVAPYMVVFSEDILVEKIRTCEGTDPSLGSAFTACVTEQVYDVPDNYYEDMGR